MLYANATANDTTMDFRGFIIQARTMADDSPVGQFINGTNANQQVRCTNNVSV